jgi:hypothetical protein
MHIFTKTKQKNKTIKHHRIQERNTKLQHKPSHDRMVKEKPATKVSNDNIKAVYYTIFRSQVTLKCRSNVVVPSFTQSRKTLITIASGLKSEILK